MPAKIRKIIVQTDEVRVEMGRDVQPPVRKALAMAVIENPCAGRYVENLDELVAAGAMGLGLGGVEDDAILAAAPDGHGKGDHLLHRRAELALAVRGGHQATECGHGLAVGLVERGGAGVHLGQFLFRAHSSTMPPSTTRLCPVM